MKQQDFALHALRPLDGRYEPSVKALRVYFSEYATIKARTSIEIKYFLALCAHPKIKNLQDFPQEGKDFMQGIVDNFSEQDAIAIKKIEQTTNHDIKAIEYFIKEKMEEGGYARNKEKTKEYKEMVHFGLTSQDVVHTAFGCLLKEAFEEVLCPNLLQLIESIVYKAATWRDIRMLAHTHGQPAAPTTLGKEMIVFCMRLIKQLQILNKMSITAKFGGAVGNLTAHKFAYKDVDWNDFANKFVAGLGLVRNYPTTQIDHYDDLAAFLDAWRRVQVILLDFARDMWQYISMDYFLLKVNTEETGSSTMPHKINPIDFENAEGNLGLANALCTHLSTKLPVSRLQRDLSDSTVLRNVGTLFGYTLLALKGLQKGLAKVRPNRAKINEDLKKDWKLVGEGIQSILKREGFPKPYETLKELTRHNKKLAKAKITSFIKSLKAPESVKQELLKVKPENYIGLFQELEKGLKESLEEIKASERIEKTIEASQKAN